MDMKKQKEEMEQTTVEWDHNTAKRKTFEDGGEWKPLILWEAVHDHYDWKNKQCSFYVTGKPADLVAFMRRLGGDWDVKESKGEQVSTVT